MSGLRNSELVDLAKLDESIRLQIAYATSDNFTGRVIYPAARALLQKPVATALRAVQQNLLQQGLSLVILDAYRPWSVTEIFWHEYPQYRDYLADPAEGSRHNRGCAVDVTLCDALTGKHVEMPSAYDDFTECAHPGYDGGSEASRRNRDILRHAMEQQGFIIHPYEWWHFDHPLWDSYPLLNLPLDAVTAV